MSETNRRLDRYSDRQLEQLLIRTHYLILILVVAALSLGLGLLFSSDYDYLYIPALLLMLMIPLVRNRRIFIEELERRFDDDMY